MSEEEKLDEVSCELLDYILTNMPFISYYASKLLLDYQKEIGKIFKSSEGKEIFLYEPWIERLNEIKSKLIRQLEDDLDQEMMFRNDIGY